MTEHRLYDPASPPEWLDPQWWRDREHCNHLESETGAHRARLEQAAALAERAAKAAGRQHINGQPAVVDLGAGDGALLSLLPEPLRHVSFGYDFIREDVRYANAVRGVKVWIRNITHAIARESSIALGPVVVLTEVLEHMADPHGFLAKLAARDEVRYVVASSPFGETPEQHEWNHAWAWDEHGYAAMFEAAGFAPHTFIRVEWSQLWLFERDVELSTEEAVSALEAQHEDDAVDALAYGVTELAKRGKAPITREGDTFTVHEPGWYQFGTTDTGVVHDLGPYVAELLEEGRKAGLPTRVHDPRVGRWPSVDEVVPNAIAQSVRPE